MQTEQLRVVISCTWLKTSALAVGSDDRMATNSRTNARIFASNAIAAVAIAVGAAAAAEVAASSGPVRCIGRRKAACREEEK